MARAQPKYLRLHEQLAARIDRGEWLPGDRLPSEPLIAEEYGVAYMTVRSAISQLVRTGQLRRIRGRGTYVVEPEQPDVRPAIGLLLAANWHSLDPFYFPPLVSGFVEKAEQLGYQVHLADRSEPLLEIFRFRELHVSAVACVLVDEEDLDDAHELWDKGVLVVAINHYGGSRRVPSVTADNQGAAYLAARQLVQLGHRSFAYLAGPPWNLDAKERGKGVRRALRDSGIPSDSLLVMEGGFYEESGYARGKELLSKDELPTAVMSVSDLAAIGFLRAAHELGVRVPEDISVFGFGDFRLSGFVRPALTTVRLPISEIGRRAAESLIDQVRGMRPDPITLECSMVLRESIAPPRSHPFPGKSS
ncbi:MAG: GntR family transcriptional regulator [Armatimonadetes bacterium]|nr:GntR family transcriptional regulator [Armatimonadota bacterium]